MPIISQGDVFSVYVRGRLNQQRVITTFYFRITELPPGPTNDLVYLLAALQQFDLDVMPAYRNLVSILVQGIVLRGQFLWPTRGRYVDWTPPVQTGGLLGPCLPSINTTRLTRLSFTPGRRGQGRVFLPGLPVDMVSQSLYTVTFLGMMNAAKDSLLKNAMNVSDGFAQPCIYHGPGIAVTADDEIQQARAELEVSPQAQRRVGRGE